MATPRNIPAFSSVRTALITAVTCTSVLLTGCAGMGSPSSKVAATTKAEYYPQCYQPVSQLRASDQAVTQSVATGAIAGGVLGALAGGLSSDEHAGRNALIGAAGGALVGGAAGYYTARQQQIADDNARIASYATDIDSSSGELDRSIRYASAAQSCYQREFNNLMNARKSKSISDSEGRLRMAEIVAGLQETNALMAAVDGRAGENINTYTQAYERDLQTVGVERQTVTQVVAAENPVSIASQGGKATGTKASGSKASTKASTTKASTKATTAAAKKVPKEAVATERTLQKAEAKRAESQKVASQGATMVSDVCNSPDMGDWAPASCSKV
ncbi:MULTISPECIES: type VI secretion system-associated lipoprotein TagQ [Pseudomonadaceae]|uniref:type VI secretion system-associated lipoprotein TagQ n=1 Tax=Pseudomonadaceae TaxID=135621 RepID=UPI00084B3B40|nr:MULTISPECIES: type VI secretion system-associated lipoprotein TagQ [Pseudomonas]OEC52001.1 type VI secretion-associated lipoprotein TagQ [Pseudomonas sp. ENNP23]